MSEGTTQYQFNSDGTVDLTVEDKSVRFVKESDLLAVKRGSDGKVKEWENERSQLQSQLAEANRLRDETHQSLLSEQAAHEQLKSSTADYDTHKTRVGELETELGSHKESITNYEKELGDRIRANLINLGAQEDAIKEKTLDQLRNLEEAAKLFAGRNGDRKPARYDGGDGGPGGGSTPSKTERLQAILDHADSKRLPKKA